MVSCFVVEPGRCGGLSQEGICSRDVVEDDFRGFVVLDCKVASDVGIGVCDVEDPVRRGFKEVSDCIIDSSRKNCSALRTEAVKDVDLLDNLVLCVDRLHDLPEEVWGLVEYGGLLGIVGDDGCFTLQNWRACTRVLNGSRCFSPRNVIRERLNLSASSRAVSSASKGCSENSLRSSNCHL